MNHYVLEFALKAHKDAPAFSDRVTVVAPDLEEAEYTGLEALAERHPGCFTLAHLTAYTERLIICGSALEVA